MVKVYKDNQVLSISENELEYYKSLGYKKVGEKEAPKNGVSSADYKKLMEEKETIATELVTVKTDLEEANKTIASKDEEIKTLTEDNNKLASDLEEANKKLEETKKTDAKGEK